MYHSGLQTCASRRRHFTWHLEKPRQIEDALKPVDELIVGYSYPADATSVAVGT